MEEIYALTDKGGKYEITDSTKTKLVLLSNGKVLVDENYRNDINVVNKIILYKNIIKEDSQPLVKNDDVKYVNPLEVAKYYNDTSRMSFINNANVIQKSIIDLIAVAFKERTTDIHIVLQDTSTYIYFRILGDLRLYLTKTYDDGNAMCTTLYNTMTTTSGTSYNPRETQDANISGQFLPDGLSGIRVATGPTQGGNNFMVLRLLPKGTNVTLEDLGFSKSQLKQIMRFLACHAGGITLISGPTGSGKSTTLQALMKLLLLYFQGAANMITVEDPVEYPISVEVEIESTKLDSNDEAHSVKEKVVYAARQIAIPSTSDHELKKELYRKTIVAAMRQDPDLIMLGEIRDCATADAAITASNTGHPVLSTVHARNATMIIDRLITIGADRNLLLSPKMLNGLIAQHLIPMLCPKCKVKLSDNLDLIDDELKARLENAFDGLGGVEGIYLKSKVGLKGCGHYEESLDSICVDGLIGRSVLAEIIAPDETYLQLMREEKINDAYNYWLNDLDGFTMMCHGLSKVKKGLVDPRHLESKLELITPQLNLEKVVHDAL